MPRDLAVGIDLGGTSIKSCLVDFAGDIVVDAPTDIRRTSDSWTASDWVDNITAGAKRVADDVWGDVKTVGISSVGGFYVDKNFREGRIDDSPPAPFSGLANTPLRDLVSDELNRPVLIEHDGRCIGFAAQAVAPPDSKRLAALAVGTTYGASYFVDGALQKIRGLWEMRVPQADGTELSVRELETPRDVPLCFPPFVLGALYDLLPDDPGADFDWPQSWQHLLDPDVGGHFFYPASSAAGGVQVGREVSPWRTRSRLSASDLSVDGAGRLDLFSPEELAIRARGGDVRAQAVWNYFGESVGNQLSYLHRTFDPDAVVIGGGVAQAGELFLEPAKRRLAELVDDSDEIRVSVHPSPRFAPAIGAALNAIRDLS